MQRSKEILGGLRKVFLPAGLKSGAKLILNGIVDICAKILDWHFPEKFAWDWKLEMILGRYEKETTELFKRIVKPGMVVVDAGAHIGYFTRLFARLVGPSGRVCAFEPDPDNFALLKQNTVRYPRVQPFVIALSDKSQHIEFYRHPTKTGSHSLIPQVESMEKIVVLAESLDSFCHRVEVHHIDIIKIDVEGAEPQVLNGMQRLRQNNPDMKIVIEFQPENLKDPAALFAQLQKYLSVEYDIYSSTDGFKSAITEYPQKYANLLVIRKYDKITPANGKI